MEYDNFLYNKRTILSAVGVEPAKLNSKLFPFQQALVRWACKRGRAAIFADTGLGKTVMQLEWSQQIFRHTGGKILIIAPLCVSQQTVEEGARFGYTVEYTRTEKDAPGVYITNYEMLERFDLQNYSAVVLDESSILKHQAGKTRTALIDACANVPYRLSCTATPSPNDYMELGNQAEFLGIMRMPEMLATFFIHDGGETQKWRLKGHGERKFWEWLSQWAMCVRKPSNIGFSDDGYDLPPLTFKQATVKATHTLEGELFPMIARSLQERISARRQTVNERAKVCAQVVNQSSEQWLVWCHLNSEADELAQLIPDAIEVRGADSIEKKELALNDFAHGRIRVLITKPSIAGFGMNFQGCHKMAFVGLNDSWEEFYQAVRRCWRFGQTKPVDVLIVSSDIEGAVIENLKRKEEQMEKMMDSLIEHTKGMATKELSGTTRDTAPYLRQVEIGDNWTAHLGDCVDVVKEMADGVIDYCIFSPPFSSLYTYSNSDRDMGNCTNDSEFMQHFGFLVKELYRVMAPGRDLSFHCMNLPTSKQNHGYIGIRDFRGELIRLFESHGFIFHSEVCIWKDPVTAMQRTKALGLLWKQIKKDSAMCRQGIPDYVVTMRKPGENTKPISHTAEEFPVAQWQKYASPVWMDIDQSRTLNRDGARENEDERHIAPLQLDVIERCLALWSRPGDLVLSPFMGIGSEGYCAVRMNRRFIGVELKRSYYQLALRHLNDAVNSKMTLL